MNATAVRAIVFIALLVGVVGAALVEFQLGKANAEIPSGVQHDDAWKAYHRVRQTNRVSLGAMGVLAVVVVGAMWLGRRQVGDPNR